MATEFDARLAAELEGEFEGLIEQLRKAATSSVVVTVREPCGRPGCGCKHFRTVEVPDYKTKLQIAEFLANRGHGRPGQAAVEDVGERITVVRNVYYPESGGG